MTVMKVPKKKVWKCLRERKVADIDLLKPDTIPQLIVEVVKVVGIGINILSILPQVIIYVVGVVQV